MAVPKYMKDQEKRGPGQPPKFKTVEELQEAVDKYFNDCLNFTRDVVTKQGDVVTILDPQPLTMSGLAYAIGVDRRTLVNYSHKEQFFPTIKKARERVEQDMETRMLSGRSNCIGSIFSFKNNYDWKDTRELNANVKVTDALSERLRKAREKVSASQQDSGEE